jgi:release factor glutamine methyltransferase
MTAEMQANNTAWTIARLLTWTTDYLEREQIDEPRLSAELLLAHALDCRKIELYTRFDSVPAEPARAAFRELVRRAARHEPIAYLVGHKEFYSLDFEVSPAVLIPRPETELLAERVVEHCRRLGDRPIRILDVGTGTGCVAIAILTQVAAARGVATDVSAAAVEIAGRNRDRHGLTNRLCVIEADGLTLPIKEQVADPVDVLVSNPPYIPEGDLASLPAMVRDYEPQAALCGGRDGLDFFRLFAERAHGILGPGGSIFVEIGYDQRDAVCGLFAATGRYALGGVWRDTGAPHDRVLQFIYQKG